MPQSVDFTQMVYGVLFVDDCHLYAWRGEGTQSYNFDLMNTRYFADVPDVGLEHIERQLPTTLMPNT